MKKIYIVIFLAISISNVFAQEGKTISLKEAIRTALENNPSGKLSRAKIDVANARYNQALDATIPSVKVIAGYSRLSNIDEFKTTFPGQTEPVTFFPNIPNNYTTRASLSETIFSGFRLKYARESQKLLLEAVLNDAEKDSDELVYAIVNAYYNIYKIKQSQNVIASNFARINGHLNNAVEWEKNGIATHNEILKWQMQKANAELLQLDLQNNLDIATFNFGLALGMHEKATIEEDTLALFPSRELKSVQEYLQLAAANRGDMKAMQNRKIASQNIFNVAKNSYYPTISMGANYYYSRPNSRIFPVTDEFKQTWDAGVMLTWDITNLYSNRHTISEAKATYVQYESQENMLSYNIQMEVNQQYTTYIEALKKIDVLKKSISLAEENYFITDQKYKNQLLLLSELQDADDALIQSQINLITSRADAEIAYYKLLKATGSIQ